MTRRGDWIQTFSGRKFWPLDPRPEDVDILDIAAALSKQCRFGGHCQQHYSVAEHSVRVAALVQNLYALLHDAHEAYLVDVPTPIKRNLAGYERMAARVQATIHERFGLDEMLPAQASAIHKADRILLITEERDLMAMQPHQPPGWPEPLRDPIVPWAIETARVAFIRWFEEFDIRRTSGRRK